MKTKRLKGFTFVELAVVLVIISLLSGIGFISYTGSKSKSNFVKVRSDMQEILTAAKSYRLEKKRYPMDGFPANLPPEKNASYATGGYLAPGQAPPSDSHDTYFKQLLSSWPIGPCGNEYAYDWENWTGAPSPYPGGIANPSVRGEVRVTYRRNKNPNLDGQLSVLSSCIEGDSVTRKCQIPNPVSGWDKDETVQDISSGSINAITCKE